MESSNGENSAIAVIWYDGSQECKILNVASTREHHEETSDRLCARTIDIADDVSIGENYIDGNVIATRGIDNAAFVANNEQSDCVLERLEDASPCCSTSGATARRLSCDGGNDSNNPCEEQTTYRTSNTSACPSREGTSNYYAHDNPAFEMPNELSYDAVVKHSPMHPNVYLVRNRSSASELKSSCTCPANEVILQVRSTELDGDSNVASSNDDALDNKLHFLRRGTVAPDCNIHISDITGCSSSSCSKKTDGECSEPPPHYSSLRFMFLEDEPPKYQDVTGKKLAMGDPPKMQQAATSKWKRRIIVVAVIIFIVLIGALLVYACFVSGHPLGAYGSVPRKF